MKEVKSSAVTLLLKKVFNVLLLNLGLKYLFELDTLHKQDILRLKVVNLHF